MHKIISQKIIINIIDYLNPPKVIKQPILTVIKCNKQKKNILQFAMRLCREKALEKQNLGIGQILALCEIVRF